MTPMKIIRQSPSHPMLKPLIKFLWLMESDESMMVNQRLMPVCNSDLIVNLSAAITYTRADGVVTSLAGIHLCGIRRQESRVEQRGPLRVIAYWCSISPRGAISIFENAIGKIF